MTDTKNLQVGDVVHVRGTVGHIGKHAITVSWGKMEMSLIPQHAIIHIEPPPPLKVGDRVRHRNQSGAHRFYANGAEYEVRAVDRDYALIRAPGGVGSWALAVRVSELEAVGDTNA
jgi:hypothetical protein